MKTAFYISLVLTVTGGINWGLVGLFGVDLVASLFGAGTIVTLAIYTIVGVAALALAILSTKVNVPESQFATPKTLTP